MSKTGLTEDELMRHFVLHRTQLYAYVHAIVRDFHSAEDILQEVALVLIRRRADYDHACSFLAWAMGIARFKSLECLRARKEPVIALGDSLLAKAESSLVRLTSGNRLDRRREALNDCLDTIGGRGRKVLEMKYARRLSAKDISAVIDRSLKATNSLLQRLRAKLTECVERRLSPESTA